MISSRRAEVITNLTICLNSLLREPTQTTYSKLKQRQEKKTLSEPWQWQHDYLATCNHSYERISEGHLNFGLSSGLLSAHEAPSPELLATKKMKDAIYTSYISPSL